MPPPKEGDEKGWEKKKKKKGNSLPDLKIVDKALSAVPSHGMGNALSKAKLLKRMNACAASRYFLNNKGGAVDKRECLVFGLR